MNALGHAAQLTDLPGKAAEGEDVHARQDAR
jgi:hypothetical protein